MNKTEVKSVSDLYKNRYKWYLDSASDIAKIEVGAMKEILKLILTTQEINAIENDCRVSSQYIKEIFQNAEQHLNKLNINVLLKWTMYDLENAIDEAQYHKDENEESWKCLNACYRLLVMEKEKGKIA